MQVKFRFVNAHECGDAFHVAHDLRSVRSVLHEQLSDRQNQFGFLPDFGERVAQKFLLFAVVSFKVVVFHKKTPPAPIIAYERGFFIARKNFSDNVFALAVNNRIGSVVIVAGGAFLEVSQIYDVKIDDRNHHGKPPPTRMFGVMQAANRYHDA